MYCVMGNRVKRKLHTILTCSKRETGYHFSLLISVCIKNPRILLPEKTKIFTYKLMTINITS